LANSCLLVRDDGVWLCNDVDNEPMSKRERNWNAFQSMEDAYDAGYWQCQRDLMMLMLQLNSWNAQSIESLTQELISHATKEDIR
jgi:hypothetical protein